MRKLLIPMLVLATCGVTACGSSSKSSSSKSASTSTSTSGSVTTATLKAKPASHKKGAKASAKVVGRAYKVNLTGAAETPKGAPKGSGSAVIALRGKTDQVCWKFTELKGFSGPTFAHIHKGAPGSSGPVFVPLSTGAKFQALGCVKTSPANLKAIAKTPKGYYVNIHSKKYPGGAVRAQL